MLKRGHSSILVQFVHRLAFYSVFFFFSLLLVSLAWLRSSFYFEL